MHGGEIDRYRERRVYREEEESIIYDTTSDRSQGWSSQGYPQVVSLPSGTFSLVVGKNDITLDTNLSINHVPTTQTKREVLYSPGLGRRQVKVDIQEHTKKYNSCGG